MQKISASAAPPDALRRFHENRSGALFVEFIIAFIPTFVLYLGVTEVALLYVSKLKVVRAASAASRAAAVVLPDHPDAYDDEDVNSYSGKRKEDIEAAAGITLLSTMTPNRYEVTFNDGADSVGPNENITINVKYTHLCIMPIVRGIVCKSFFGFGFGTYVDDTATITNHGANYSYDELTD